jgi:hypothetical protein
MFLGQNSPTECFVNQPISRPETRLVYTPPLKNENRYNRWSGVKVYDMKKETLEGAFPYRGEN